MYIKQSVINKAARKRLKQLVYQKVKASAENSGVSRIMADHFAKHGVKMVLANRITPMLAKIMAS